MTHARRPHAMFVALAFVATALAAVPRRSPAASTHPVALAKHAVAAKKWQPKPSGYHPKYTNAPADEYFGRLQMSILGVRNKVKDLGLQADLHPDQDRAVLNNAKWVEDAMRDWAQKYPFDRWLPRYAWALEQMYEAIPGYDAHKRALKQLGYVTAYFPQTIYGKVGRAKLAMGVPTPDPADPPEQVKTDLQRLALIDGKVVPTLPPAPMPKPTATPIPGSSAIERPR